MKINPYPTHPSHRPWRDPKNVKLRPQRWDMSIQCRSSKDMGGPTAGKGSTVSRVAKSIRWNEKGSHRHARPLEHAKLCNPARTGFYFGYLFFLSNSKGFCCCCCCCFFKVVCSTVDTWGKSVGETPNIISTLEGHSAIQTKRLKFLLALQPRNSTLF